MLSVRCALCYRAWHWIGDGCMDDQEGAGSRYEGAIPRSGLIPLFESPVQESYRWGKGLNALLSSNLASVHLSLTL